ncbi:MAG: hypothetical protein K8T26_11100 [Lentisphaerae bacterium]|nr:hypothetical protein [Lentisphaerota bacterium]
MTNGHDKESGVGTAVDAVARTECGRTTPCLKLGHCPYGILVESFPLAPQGDPRRCKVWGHECPAFEVAEEFADDAGAEPADALNVKQGR